MAIVEPISEAPPAPEPARTGARAESASKKKRWLATLGGSALVAYGLARRSVPGLALALAGGALIERGVRGRRDRSRSLFGGAARLLPRLRAGQRALGRTSALGPTATHVARTVTIARPREELYRFWHDFENLPRFMRHLDRVEVIDGKRSRWTARAPAGASVSWMAEIVDDRENELIAWRSIEPADVESEGSVRFVPAPGGRGTEVHVTLDYKTGAGALGRAVAKAFGEEPEQQIRRDLHRFKQLMEAGEIPTTEGQPSGRKAA